MASHFPRSRHEHGRARPADGVKRENVRVYVGRRLTLAAAIAEGAVGWLGLGFSKPAARGATRQRHICC